MKKYTSVEVKNILKEKRPFDLISKSTVKSIKDSGVKARAALRAAKVYTMRVEVEGALYDVDFYRVATVAAIFGMSKKNVEAWIKVKVIPRPNFVDAHGVKLYTYEQVVILMNGFLAASAAVGKVKAPLLREYTFAEFAKIPHGFTTE